MLCSIFFLLLFHQVHFSLTQSDGDCVALCTLAIVTIKESLAGGSASCSVCMYHCCLLSPCVLSTTTDWERIAPCAQLYRAASYSTHQQSLHSLPSKHLILILFVYLLDFLRRMLCFCVRCGVLRVPL